MEISEPVVACISDLTFKFTGSCWGFFGRTQNIMVQDGPDSDLFVYYCKHCGSHLLITGRAWDLSFHYLFPIRLFQSNFFGVSTKSMQLSYDSRGNHVLTILLLIQGRLYAEGGLQVEGIFRINGENSQEEHIRGQLNRGDVPEGIDIHWLAGLIKAWFRELPVGLLDSLTPEQVMQCQTEDDCLELVRLLPSTEVALLDWVVNLMADVIGHEQLNKMNARNIAMVFAPNMTQGSSGGGS